MKKQYRVKKNQEIESILKEKKYVANTYFSIYKKKNSELDIDFYLDTTKPLKERNVRSF